MRDFWRGTDQTLAEFAYRFTGSSDLYQGTARRPHASINFVTAHDGFTLRDLVSYNEKHNEANGEDNRDGESHNRSWNCGAEGPTDDPAGQRAARPPARATSSTTLLLSQGVPMLLGGDEIGRTQGGNNNAYCQDNEISWFDWATADRVAAAVHPAAASGSGSAIRCSAGAAGSRAGRFTAPGSATSAGSRPAASRCRTRTGRPGFAKSLGVFLNGDAIPTPNERGERVVDDSFYVMFNAHHEALTFTLPEEKWGTALDRDARTLTRRPSWIGEERAGPELPAGGTELTCRRGRRCSCAGLTDVSRMHAASSATTSTRSAGGTGRRPATVARHRQRAMAGAVAGRGPHGVVVVGGARGSVGPAELRLEDGTLADDRSPAAARPARRLSPDRARGQSRRHG